ncbi:hypothetical protein SRB5_56850 [Streptomyces sp. RB5]|uniref:HTH gntR-type domain-containing protein n=1 Tax=Streptomyces smaragdinus TaxID=2585196 RepID=A0A7K0CQA0_9ACTN|nr:GntR family transcriptional regulator [Streptomyces smaragdinus]MQY15503.1 hypothetical protein [Streptomyces smaragdinus]
MSIGEAGTGPRGDSTVRDPARVPVQRGGAERAPVRLDRASVRAKTLAALRAALADGRLRPGEVYSAPVLAAPLGVSATPVREAMQILAAEGAVEVLPNRGFRIVPPPVAAHVAAVRALLVLPVVAAHPPDPVYLRPLAEEAGAAADRAFHAALLAPAGNPELDRVAADLYDRAALPPSPPHARLALLRALTDGDADLVRDLLETLLGA